MKAAVEQVFNGSLVANGIGASYNATQINRGKHGGQYNLGGGETDKFIGPAPLGVANLAESPLAIPSQFVHPVKIADDLFWIFGADGATAAATRRVQLWTWVPSTNTYTFRGAINCTFPTATAHTVRGIRAILENFTTGTVWASETTEFNATAPPDRYGRLPVYRTCANGGNCTRPNTCSCEKGWAGPDCATPLCAQAWPPAAVQPPQVRAPSR